MCVCGWESTSNLLRTVSVDTRSSTEKVDLEEFHFRGLTLNRRNSRKARVLYDYDKSQEDEISVTAEQVGSSCWRVPCVDHHNISISSVAVCDRLPCSWE